MRKIRSSTTPEASAKTVVGEAQVVIGDAERLKEPQTALETPTKASPQKTAKAKAVAKVSPKRKAPAKGKAKAAPRKRAAEATRRDFVQASIDQRDPGPEKGRYFERVREEDPTV